MRLQEPVNRLSFTQNPQLTTQRFMEMDDNTKQITVVTDRANRSQAKSDLERAGLTVVEETKLNIDGDERIKLRAKNFQIKTTQPGRIFSD